MQTIPAEFETAIKRGYAIEGKSLIIAEWNYNNLFNTIVTNPPDDQNWILNKELFPLKSVASGFRPKNGIFYGFTDESLTSGSDVGLDSNRYYTLDDINKYKYWVCPTPSSVSPPGADAVFAGPYEYEIARGTLIVDYGQFLNMNKVSVTFNLGPLPVDWSIWLFEQTSNDWVEILNPDINIFTGQAQVWWNGTSWIQTQQLDEEKYQHISKIKIEVRKVNAPGKRLQVVEIAGKREIDLTARTESYSVNTSMDNQDFIYPVGRMSSNDGNIVFNNNDLKMDHANVTSDFYGALVGWCEYRTYVRYDLSPWLGSSDYIVQTGKMYANDFQQKNEFEYDVQLFDVFKIIQSITCPALFIEDESMARIIATLLDMVGIDAYSFEFADWDATNTVKYFWTDGTEKLFDVLDKLVKSFQAALFVDETGLIRLLTRNDIIPTIDETPIWTFRGAQDGLDLPDIVHLDKKYSLQINKLNIKYTKRQAKVDDLDLTGQPLTSSVWEASDPIVLRAAPLTRMLSETPIVGDYDDVWIPIPVAETWPFKGKVNVDGELIEYDGKNYAYWTHDTGTPIYNEGIVKNNDDRKLLDKTSYESYIVDGVLGGVSKDPSQRNGYTGRLVISKRDADESGQRKKHTPTQSDGWYAMDFWTEASNSWGFPGKYFTPGGDIYNLTNLKDWTNKTNWTECQYRISISDSVTTINNATNNSAPDHATHATVLVKDHPDTEYREIGTRLRFHAGSKGRAIIPFYMTNAVGYDNENPPITEVFDATRCYVLNVCTSEYADSIDRSRNEIWVDYKSGSVLQSVNTLSQGGIDGKVKIDAEKWYDIEFVFRDGSGDILEGGGVFGSRTAIEVYVDGAYIETWCPAADQNIRPTSLIGIGAKDTSIVDFEYLYGSTTTSKGRFNYTDDDLFDAQTIQLPAGTNIEYNITLPVENDWLGEGVISLATFNNNVTLQEIEVFKYASTSSVKLVGSSALVLKPEQRLSFLINDIMPDAARVKIKYTAVQSISLCLEYSNARNFPYGIDNEPIPPVNSFYDRLKNGYISGKANELFFTPQKYHGTQFLSHEITTPIFLSYFFEDFGAIVHEVRDFTVDLDSSPAKGVSIYSSNLKVEVIDYKYNPVKGIFTLVNTSHRDEIVNGTEQVDESNSIDQALMLYGYVLESKGDDTETVTNDLSILRHDVVAEDLDATWIFSKEEAKSLGIWVTSHWGESMDTITMETFCSTFIQIGDKVSIFYPNCNIDSSWLFIVTDKNIDLSAAGLITSVTVRKVIS